MDIRDMNKAVRKEKVKKVALVAGQAALVILVILLLALGINEVLALVSGHQFGWVKA